MTRFGCVALLALAYLYPSSETMADEATELRKQRQEAHKDRQARKRERLKEVSTAGTSFREFARQLKADYKEQVRELDTEFELRRVELQAEHKARVAGAEAEFQKKLSALFMKPGTNLDRQAIEDLQAQGKSFADELFALRKQSAETLHREQIALEERKNALLTERDRAVLDEAESLGLTREHAPILATPIGDGLTDQERKWNQRERKEVAKIMERNRKLLNEYRNGESLRKWEIANLNEDFKLTWEEKAEENALDSQKVFYNMLFMQTAQGGALDQQALMAELAELEKQKKLIKIKYQSMRDRNRIKRREEKKKIVAG